MLKAVLRLSRQSNLYPQCLTIRNVKPLGEHLPVKYYLIDFGPSILLEESSGPLVPPLRLAPHRTSAPEVDSGDPFDPFAADVYQTAVFMLEHFYVGPRVAAFLLSR